MPSTVILAMSYNPAREELLIVFRNGRGTYRYFNVSLAEWQDFLEAESKGTYLNCVFKQKEHPYERTDEVVRFSGRMRGEMRLEWGEMAVPRKAPQRVEAPAGAAKSTA